VSRVAPAPVGVGPEVLTRLDSDRRVHCSVGVRIDLEGHGKETLGAGTVRGKSRFSGRLPALARGVYRIRSAVLTSTWPLGMLRVTKEVPAPAEVVVYPAPADLADTPAGSEGMSALLTALGGRSAGIQPSHFREYHVGDELRRVHWKASARRDTLVITEWDGGAGNGAEVVLDRRAATAAFEAALSLLAAIAIAARDAKETLTIHTQGSSATYGTGHMPFSGALRFLAATTALPESGPPPPPASPEILRLPVAGGTR